MAFNPPPTWPEPPSLEWEPPEGWTPPAEWGPAPAGWRFHRSDLDAKGARAMTKNASRPIATSGSLPASGTVIPQRPDSYPITVVNPGMWTEDVRAATTYGFPIPRAKAERPRTRLGIIIVCLVAGLIITAAAAYGFVWLTHWSRENAPVLPESATARVIFDTDDDARGTS